MKVVNGILANVNTKDLKNGVLIIPEGVTEIYYRSLENVRKDIKKVLFPKSMKVIQSYSFTKCESLEEVIFPEELEEIEESAFHGCSHLSNVKLPSTLKKIGRAAFAGTEITTITIPKEIKYIEPNIFSGCSKLEKVILEEGITTIEESVFQNCTNLKEIVLPSSLISIESMAFKNCENLKNIAFPENLENIGYYAFQYAGLVKVELPSKITKIAPGVFSYCNNLKEVILNENITEIGRSAFSYTTIENIKLPNSISKIGVSAFYHCLRLEKAILPENLETIEGTTYAGCLNISEVRFPKNLKRIDGSAFENCINLKKVTLSENLISIGMNAFSGCESLSELNLPRNLETIEGNAFFGCFNIQHISIGDNIKTIGYNAFRGTDANTLITPWGKYMNRDSKVENIIIPYLYLFSNNILKEKYENMEAFLENKDISETLSRREAPIINPEGIQKFKNLFSKLRKEYNVKSSLLPLLPLQTTENLSYSTWKKVMDTFESFLSIPGMDEALCEMIEVLGLFHKDQTTNQRIEQFQKLLKETKITISIAEYQELLEDFKYDELSSSYGIEELEKSFDKQEIEVYKLKSIDSVPKEFAMYLSNSSILTPEERKMLKRVTGSYGKRLNDYINENYELETVSVYTLNKFGNDNSNIKNYLINLEISGCLNGATLHNIFDGCEKKFDEDFYNFLIDNLLFILKRHTIQSNVKEIQKNFESIKKYYLRNAGSEKITLKQALDYIKDIRFDYHKGNYELMLEAKKAGVTSQETFDYYQEVYKKNQVRKLYSLVRRSNIYEIDGYTIKAELLRKDDPFTMLVGEKNYTNCCQVYGSVGHNCMAHATGSDDGGIFVTRLLKDGEWILLTESWDWQNNNLYCHDNVEGTEFFKNGPKNLKRAVMKALELDAELIMEKSKKELEESGKLEQREVIKAVTVGAGYDDLGLKHFLSKKININKEFFMDNKKYSLNNFQPLNYNSSKPYFNQNFIAYSDAESKQYILAGNIDDLATEKKELEPIYRDERRIVKEEKESIRDNTEHKISKIKKQIYSKKMRDFYSKDDFSNSVIYLGEDWYLIFEPREDQSIYISDLARINPTLEDEKGIQQEEILSTVYGLINENDYIEADLKEDTSYLLYLMNKRLGYIEQIGEDISYSYDDMENKKVVTIEEQQEILKQIRRIREEKNPNHMIHKVKFKKK